MHLIDRYIIKQFLLNFALLFSLLFIFAVSIDLMLQLDEFVEVAHDNLGNDAGGFSVSFEVFRIVLNFHGPRVFQFYAYLMGIVAIGAMGFTLAGMHRHKELVAVMAAGVSLHRIAWPFLIAAFGLNVVQLLNQELMLPRIAPMLIRDRGDIGRHTVDAFPISFTKDGRGNLLLAASFDPQSGVMTSPTILVRDDKGRAIERITADRANWNQERSGWVLINGRKLLKRNPIEDPGDRNIRQPIDFYETDITPQTLTIQQYGQYAAMLSMKQISDMLSASEAVDRNRLLRYRYFRFSAVLVNLLVMVICMPFFLLREPSSLMRQSLLCAAAAIPTTIGAIAGMAINTGLPPALAVFLPPLVLFIVGLWRVMELRT